MGDAWRQQMLQNTTVIASIGESSNLVESLINRTVDNVVSFDCEGINLGRKGVVTQCQIATMTGKAYIFDIHTCPGIVAEGGLRDLLENESVVKVIHDCRNDSVSLYNQFGITLKNVFDTQVAHSVLQRKRKIELSLNALCELYNAPMNPMKEQLKNVYRRDQRYWARRPLTKDMILYSASDVLCLINPAIYTYISSNIQPENYQLLKNLTKKRIIVHKQPAVMKRRRWRQRKIKTGRVNKTARET